MNTTQSARSGYSETPLLQHGSPFRLAWCQRMPAGQTNGLLKLPDGTVDIVLTDGGLLVSGPDRFAQHERIKPGSTITGLRFARGAASAWLGVAMRELVGQRVLLDDIVGRRRSEEVAAAFRAISDPAFVPDVMEQSFLRTTDQAGPRFAKAVIGAIHAATVEDAILPAIVRATGLTERTLRRRCNQIFGCGPRTLSRLLRLQRLLSLLRTDADQTLASAAAAGGFADQPHMTREVRTLTTLSPTALMNMIANEDTLNCNILLWTCGDH